MSINFLMAAAAPGQTQNLSQTAVMVGLAVLFFYFILWRPENKRRKKVESMRKSIKKGDRVVAMGMCAIVDDVRERTVILKQVDGAKIEMLSAAISEVLSDESSAPAKA